MTKSVKVVPSPKATLKDVAECCGLSISAVSRALRGKGNYAAATVERIKAAAATLGYDPLSNIGASRLALSRFGKGVINHLIGVLCPSTLFKLNYFAQLFHGIAEELSAQGFGLLIVDVPPDMPTQLPSSFARGDVDGVISMVAREFPSILTRLRATPGFGQKPVVVITASFPGCSTVRIDPCDGGYQIASHLLDLGHRHLLCCVEGDTAEGFTRMQTVGYRAAYAAHHLDPEQYLHIYPSVPHPVVSSAKLQGLLALQPTPPTQRYLPKWWLPLRDYLLAHREITAIMAPNDAVALLFRSLLVREGLRVPEEMSITGVDDTDPLLDSDGRYALTTLRLPLRKMARAATRLVVQQVTGQAPLQQTITLPT
ncbi:MAG TPA: LacI family DNA-binding transcriptional regulator, partial [Armatimonadota bacterium]